MRRDLIKWWLVPQLEPWWRDQRPFLFRSDHQLLWLIGWGWTLAGLMGGALIAPLVVQLAHVPTGPYQDLLVIGIAVVTGILVQLLSLSFLFLMSFTVDKGAGDDGGAWPYIAGVVVLVAYVLPFCLVFYGIYLYFTWVGANQRSVTLAFAGGLPINAFTIPAIWGALQSKAFKAFMNWLRGDKT